MKDKDGNKMMKIVKKIIAATAAAHFANKLIFALSALNKRPSGKKYRWSYGNVRYTVAGHGKPLVLVHGLVPWGGRAEWEQAAKFLARNYTVYAVDLLGYGFSDKPKVTYSSYLYVSMLNDFIKDVIGKPAFVAACRGAAPIVAAAAVLAPENFARMMFVSPADAASKNEFGKVGKIVGLPVYGTLLYNILASRPVTSLILRRIMKNKKPGAAASYGYPARYGGAASRIAAAANFSGYMSVDIVGLMDKITQPVRVVAGGKDKAGLKLYKRMRDENPAAGLTVFQAAGRMPHDENPQGFYKACRGFFG